MNHALHECKDVRVLHFPLLDYSALIDDYERGPFEGRNLAAGARLYEKMIN